MHKSLLKGALAILVSYGVIMSPVQAAGNDITLPGTLGQSDFDSFVDQIGMAIAYNPVSPAEPLGLIGFEVGIAVSTVKIDSSIWDKVVSDGNAPSTLPVPRLMARKGLPFGIDVGLSHISVPGTNVSVTGGEIRKALIEGGMALPAVTILAHTSQLSGVDDLSLSTYGLDLGVSKGLAMVTPYAGVGQVWIKGSEKVTGLTLNERDTTQTRSYIGAKVGFLPFMSLVLQADFAEVDSYSFRLNIDF